jgi:pimeloyl-ACP methyl ester carboxylesterase
VAVAALAVLAPLAAGCSGSTSSATGAGQAGRSTTVVATPTTAPLAPFAGDDFYAVPDPLPTGPHGTLIRYQRSPGYQLGGTVTYRIMYLSESVAGKPIAVTGTASVPTAAAPKGGRPMVTIAHGTTGIGDDCAPSKHPQATELTLVGRRLATRYLLAMSDYEGLGTPGRHPYLVGESEGRSVVDAIVAAGQLPNAHPGRKVAIAGYSQGGHGALWAAQVAAAWAPKLDVVGTFAGAPASEVGVILAAAPRLPSAGFAYMVVAGIAAAYPEADPADFLTAKGVAVLREVDESCHGVFAATAGIPVDQLVKPNGMADPAWDRLAHAQDAGQRKTSDAPTLIVHSTGDHLVPLAFSELVAKRMCANGQVVERRLIDGGDHTPAAIPAYDLAIPWIEARFAADPPTPVDSCPDLG